VATGLCREQAARLSGAVWRDGEYPQCGADEC
jgi:hypothetical protein